MKNLIFATRLREARAKKGWSQSDVARRIWGTTTDSRGITVAKNRDRVSCWEKGSVPDHQNLFRLAQVLGVDVKWLLPASRSLVEDLDDLRNQLPHGEIREALTTLLARHSARAA